jgi:hypothetical protein
MIKHRYAVYIHKTINKKKQRQLGQEDDKINLL